MREICICIYCAVSTNISVAELNSRIQRTADLCVQDHTVLFVVLFSSVFDVFSSIVPVILFGSAFVCVDLHTYTYNLFDSAVLFCVSLFRSAYIHIILLILLFCSAFVCFVLHTYTWSF